MAVAERTGLLGPRHPDTLASLANLAATLFSLGRLDEALGLIEQAVAGQEAVLGPDHPDTRRSRENLRIVREAMEDRKG